MSRTYKKVPPDFNVGNENNFVEEWTRGKLGTEISAAEGKYDIAWGQRGRKIAKKRNSKNKRLQKAKSIREQLSDFDL